MKRNTLFSFIFLFFIYGCQTNTTKSVEKTENESVEEPVGKENLEIIPISHASLILEYGSHVIYIDPVGGLEKFKDHNRPTLVLITDIHQDHLDTETLAALNLENVPLIAPQAVIDLLDNNVVAKKLLLNNKEHQKIDEINIEAVAMYNLREEALKFHKKGRGNGYILTIGGQRIYISGDTEDIPEMRSLKNIDIAFVCMNLPYTMTIESAASAVLEFVPKQIYPYHYRGTEGFSDVQQFKTLVNTKNPEIEVIQLNWYPE